MFFKSILIGDISAFSLIEAGITFSQKAVNPFILGAEFGYFWIIIFWEFLNRRTGSHTGIPGNIITPLFRRLIVANKANFRCNIYVLHIFIKHRYPSARWSLQHRKLNWFIFLEYILFLRCKIIIHLIRLAWLSISTIGLPGPGPTRHIRLFKSSLSGWRLQSLVSCQGIQSLNMIFLMDALLGRWVLVERVRSVLRNNHRFNQFLVSFYDTLAPRFPLVTPAGTEWLLECCGLKFTMSYEVQVQNVGPDFNVIT